MRQDDSSLDWRRARYLVEVRVRTGSADVHHRLEQAPEMVRLIEQGYARYALELRCPRTLFAQTRLEEQSRFSVVWGPEKAEGMVYLIPGIVAIRCARIPESALSEPWKGFDTEVPAGWWLARGSVHASESLVDSLLEFRPDTKLADGAMRVNEIADGEEARFVVWLGTELFSRVRERDGQVAGLIAAFSRLPDSSRFADTQSGSWQARALRQRLEEAGVPAWDEPEDWDPARAATAIEPFATMPVDRLEGA